MNALDRLILGRGYEQGTAAITFGAAANYSATSSARYSVSGTTVATFGNTNLSNLRWPLFVEVFNYDASIWIYVNVGNSNVVPATATAGAGGAAPGGSIILPLEDDGIPFVNCLAASGSPTGAIKWYLGYNR